MNRVARLALLAGGAGLFGVALLTEFPMCPLASSVGIPCPGCGLTRATLALLQGDWGSALHFHPLVWLLTPVFVTFIGISGVELLRDPARARPPARINWLGRGPSVMATVLLVLSLGVWLARFAGYFGGPAPVTTLRSWLAR